MEPERAPPCSSGSGFDCAFSCSLLSSAHTNTSAAAATIAEKNLIFSYVVVCNSSSKVFFLAIGRGLWCAISLCLKWADLVVMCDESNVPVRSSLDDPRRNAHKEITSSSQRKFSANVFFFRPSTLRLSKDMQILSP